MGGPTENEERLWDEQREHRQLVDGAVRRLRAQVEAKAIVDAERAAVEQVPPFDAGLLGEVLARPAEPDFRVEDLVPADGGALIIAQRKTGKTTLQLNLARCLIEGSDFLGKFPTVKLDGNVAILNYEVSARTLARWAHDTGIPHDRLFLVNLRGRRNPLSNPRDRQLLADRLRLHDTEALFVDPFGRAYTGTSQNDPGEVGAFLADLDRFARGDAGARDLALTAHAGWNGERTRGSSALEDWADSYINLTRDDENLRYLRAEGRDVHVPEDQLTYDETTRTLAGAGSRKATAKTKQAEALIPLILELLAETPSMSGNALDRAITKRIAEEGLDLKHSKGDGAKAAQLLERRKQVGSKDGTRGARLFTLLTSPTSLVLPSGNSGDLPSSPIGREVAQGTGPTSPAEGTHDREST